MNRAEIIIGRGVQSDHVMIRVLGRMHPGCTDFWDGNRLISPVRVQVGGFIAEIAAGLRTEELHSFRAGLERIYAEVKGRAILSSREHWVELTIECRPTGSLLIFGTIADDPGMWNTLHFVIEGLDQTDIPPLVDALTALEKSFPILGRE
ncbi:WapI family immunity protein [Streptosporangium sp. NBC_01756]|uniref:WapI family immunity protein n=1 Tax=Streptosporangium sp. NBC_01756 TaxID=2975950 RepID=UPI002DD8A1A6|nr:hypothetical protein [Streptosporangium sp. NBC_01756]WSC88382.1 hypothetical protein OIE48_09405 [Streptosporangium sp. NBC_01756]